MKNKKIKLEDLKVKSFVTEKNQEEKQTVKGGENHSAKHSGCEVCTFVWCTTATGDLGGGGSV